MSKWLVVLPIVALGYIAPTTGAAAPRDRDHDRLPDRWERRHDLSPTKPNGKRDPDGDHLRNRREFRIRTHPKRADTDRDRLRDGAEVRRFHTNPRKRDTDGDGLSDWREIRRLHTNPRKRDTDGDGSATEPRCAGERTRATPRVTPAVESRIHLARRPADSRTRPAPGCRLDGSLPKRGPALWRSTKRAPWCRISASRTAPTSWSGRPM
jgi:Bacterial TSP3 repeat